MDHEAVNLVMEALREVSLEGLGVILASHDPCVLMVADRVICSALGA